MMACGIDFVGSREDPPDATADGSLPPIDSGVSPDTATAPPPDTCNSPSLQAGAPWPMIGGCVGHQGRTVFRGPHKQPVRMWERELGKSYKPMPIIGADDMIYVPADTDGVRVFAPDGGARQLPTPGKNVTNVPAIGATGTLYFGASHDAVTHFSDGGRRAYDMGEEIDSSPVLDAQGNSYFVSMADHVVSFDPAGAKRWEHDTGGDVNSSIAIGPSGDLYVGVRNNGLVAFRAADGGRLWRFDTLGDTQSSPVIADDGTIYIGTLAKQLHALSPTGVLKWTHDLPGPVEFQVLPALAADGTVYVPNGTTVVALTPAGARKWTFEAGGAIRSSAIVDADGVIYFAGDGKRGFALTPDGKELWRVDVDDTPFGLAIGRDGTIYYTCESDSRIHAFHE
jgi:outer membrane protein assembly factor BamB